MKFFLRLFFTILNNLIVFSLLIISFSFFYHAFKKKFNRTFNNKFLIYIEKIPIYVLEKVNKKIYFVYNNLDIVAIFLGLFVLLFEMIISNCLEYIYLKIFFY